MIRMLLPIILLTLLPFSISHTLLNGDPTTDDYSPLWSPNARRFVYASGPYEHSDLYVMNLYDTQ